MKTDCYVVRDLLALYMEHMVSDETGTYIAGHLAQCPDCRREYERLQKGDVLEVLKGSEDPQQSQSRPFRKVMGKLNRQMYALAYGLTVFFILWGFSLTGGEDLMYNSVIMPIVGVFGYYVFRWKAVYKLPLLLLVLDLLVCWLGFAQIELSAVFPWTVIYSMFVVIGVLIAFLLHFVFGKERKP